MTALEIEWPDCQGHGWRMDPFKPDDGHHCPDCHGAGWREMTDAELEAAAEQQAEDAMSEPAPTLNEQYRAAWDQKQELRG